MKQHAAHAPPAWFPKSLGTSVSGGPAGRSHLGVTTGRASHMQPRHEGGGRWPPHAARTRGKEIPASGRFLVSRQSGPNGVASAYTSVTWRSLPIHRFPPPPTCVGAVAACRADGECRSATRVPAQERCLPAGHSVPSFHWNPLRQSSPGSTLGTSVAPTPLTPGPGRATPRDPREGEGGHKRLTSDRNVRGGPRRTTSPPSARLLGGVRLGCSPFRHHPRPRGGRGARIRGAGTSHACSACSRRRG